MEDVLAEIIVQFDRKAVSTGEAGRAIHRIAESVGGSGRPLHPDANEPELQAFFVVEVADAEVAPESLERIRTRRSVEAAYMKPATEHP